MDDLTYSSMCASCRRRLLLAMKGHTDTFCRRSIFAERLKQARKAKHLSQKQLEQKVGISASSICHYEKKIVMPSDYCVIRIAKALRVNPMWLIGMSEEMEVVDDESTDDPRKPDKRS